MKKFLVVAGLCALALSLPVASYAKKGGKKGGGGEATTVPSDVYAKYDTNSDGTLDDTEKTALKNALKDDESLKQYDTNSDGQLSDDEISSIPATKSSGGEEGGGKKHGKKGKKK